LEIRGTGQWKVNLIADRSDLILFVADLHRQGATDVIVNPRPDGTGGTDLPLVCMLQADLPPLLL
jgi:hypothetical protein